ncbi:hypothetical protein [Pontibacillus litoralis]|uniref:Uncharacterized protein n=1 Tax=Pontibacillus litoralis JSM 072002 TaxID=1385512 RepID=A0A0A5G559_9BACI|nr:hypothetical protein [Pontibacillus litoralis]KGX88261.1 hypothetical protein N784_10450 [Pontibacillus litoralis JSM 072002]
MKVLGEYAKSLTYYNELTDDFTKECHQAEKIRVLVSKTYDFLTALSFSLLEKKIAYIEGIIDKNTKTVRWQDSLIAIATNDFAIAPKQLHGILKRKRWLNQLSALYVNQKNPSHGRNLRDLDSSYT